ncbi:MAG: glycosidase, partial [Dehalococcoidia bacterium]
GASKEKMPDSVEIYPDQLIEKFRNGLNDFHRLYQHILPEDACRELETLAQLEKAEFHFPNALWIQIVYNFVLAYTFDKEFAKGDLLDSLISLHGGLLASFCLDMERLKDRICEEAERLLVLEAIRKFESLGNDFLLQRPGFLASWAMTSEALKSPVPQITYREFIPGVPLVVPTEIISKNGEVVSANSIYESVFERQKTQFEDFVYGKLQVPRKASSLEISLAVKDFLLRVERQLLPGVDVSTIEGIQRLVDNIFHHLPHDDAFSLKPEIVAGLLTRHPPLTLLTKLRYASLTELLRAYDPCDVMALASWTEEREYLEGLWKLIKENLRPEHFGRCQIKALVVSHEDFPSLVEMKDTSSLDKISSRIVVASLHKGMGGEFPKLRYQSTICKNVIEAEKFGQIWQRFAAEKSEFGQRLMRSIEGHWGREPLSAHSMFEDGILRTVGQRTGEMAEKIARDAGGDEKRLDMAENIKALNNAYHLALTLPDGKFVTCSAWSWASYSFKGGRASPSPLSLHVERDWASREFLLEYYKAIGGTEEAMEETIIELMGEGKESHDLAAILLGTEKGVEKVVPVKTLLQEQPRAGMMTQFSGNPVLEPIKEHHWESKYVLNAGVLRLDNKTYLIYRAFGDDEISRLGMAISSDGFRFTERLDEPIFTPSNDSESKGCEDPRLVIMDDRIYMTYTAFDGRVAQIALASIGIEEFKERRWDAWERQGMVFPGYTDKDAILFPEQFQGKYAMIHRVDPHIWITFSTHLSCPWPRTENRILAGATSGMMWDGKKIGAGAQPLKTRHGWLLITHGVDFNRVYRLGVMLLDLEDPTKLLYRSPNFVLEPETACDMGNGNMCWVPNVVFTCGALPLHDNQGLLSAQDELLVYFGTNDTVIGVATARIGDLIPSQFR